MAGLPVGTPWTQSCPTLCTKGLCKGIHLGKTMHCSALVNSAFSWMIRPHPPAPYWTTVVRNTPGVVTPAEGRWNQTKPHENKTKAISRAESLQHGQRCHPSPLYGCRDWRTAASVHTRPPWPHEWSIIDAWPSFTAHMNLASLPSLKPSISYLLRKSLECAWYTEHVQGVLHETRAPSKAPDSPSGDVLLMKDVSEPSEGLPLLVSCVSRMNACQYWDGGSSFIKLCQVLSSTSYLSDVAVQGSPLLFCCSMS